MAFNVLLKKLRESKGISQQGLAENLNLSQNQISKYEMGKDSPSGEVLLKIARFFDVTAEYLYTEKMEDPTTKCFGKMLFILREEQALTQEALSKKLDISPSQLLNWETGKEYPSMEKFISILDFFQISADYLLGREQFKLDISYLLSENKQLRAKLGQIKTLCD